MQESSQEFATEPVPEGHTVGWIRVALISAMVAFSLPTFVTGIEVSNAVDSRTALSAILCGNLLLSIIGAFCGAIGARTRLSSYMLTRVAFGTRGAALVNLAFAVSLLGWFGVNIDLFSGAVLRLLHDVLGIDAPGWVVELGAGLVMTMTTVYGFRAINTLSTILVPVLIAVTALLVVKALGVRPIGETLILASASELSFGHAMSSVVGGVIIGAIILPDITRFIREWRGGIYTAVLSYLVIGSVVQGAGGLAAIAFGNDDLLDVMILIGLSWAAFAIV
ncbi:MAG: cytosine permease, partial [Gammaproteobacteria bacterium]|nr:cytosine permease [Gammaproteobacteria bacterium]